MSIRYRAQAWRELVARYADVFRYFWRQRRQTQMPALKSGEAEFLPAALAIQAAPVSPGGRLVAVVLMLGLTIALAWSVFGRIDIIVNCAGKTVPTGYTKTLSSVEIARVSAVRVEEGQRVKAGDVLVELDARAADSELERAEGEYIAAELNAARSRGLLGSLEAGVVAPQLAAVAGVPTQRWLDARAQLLGQWRDYQAKLARIDSSVRRMREELVLATQRAADFAGLARTQDVSQHAWMEKEQARIELQGQIQERLTERTGLTAETRRLAQEALNEALRLMASNQQDMARAQVHRQWLRLTAPVDGTIHQLSVHTVGAAVQAAQPLLQVVPYGAAIEMEAMVENKDIGFIHEGQDAAIKLDAFEYTKFGTIAARVSRVSRDAIQDEKRGLLYSVKLTLQRSSVQLDGKDVEISAGLSGSAEIRTGTRRVIEYLISPLLQHGHESLRER